MNSMNEYNNFYARRIYWGSPSGPYHEEDNPNGTGDTIIGHVEFDSWEETPYDLTDHTPPPPPTNLTILNANYYIEAQHLTIVSLEEEYTITVTGPSLADDPSLKRLDFYINSPEASIYTEYNVSDNNYSFLWTPMDYSRFDQYLFVIAYDRNGNMAQSQFLRFQAVYSFSDLTVSNISLSDTAPISAQNVTITVTVHCQKISKGTATNVKAKIFSIESNGNQAYLGVIDFGEIDPDLDYYPDDPELGKGDVQRSLSWIAAPYLFHGDDMNFTIRVQVDPDGYVRELSETNNENITPVQVTGQSTGPPEVIVNELPSSLEDFIGFGALVTSNVRVRTVEYRFEGSEKWRGLSSSTDWDSRDYKGISNWNLVLNISAYEPGNYTFFVRAYDGLYYSESVGMSFEIEDSRAGDKDDQQQTLWFILIAVISLILIVALLLVQRSKSKSKSKSDPSNKLDLPESLESLSATSTTQAPAPHSSAPTSSNASSSSLSGSTGPRHSLPQAHSTGPRINAHSPPPPSSSPSTGKSQSTAPTSSDGSESNVPMMDSTEHSAHLITCQHCGKTIPCNPEERSIRIPCPECGKDTVVK